MIAYVYLLASSKDGAIYLGATSNLAKRIAEHRSGEGSQHTNHYQIHRLVWFQEFPDILQAREQEGRMKKWRRAWKVALIEKLNPD